MLRKGFLTVTILLLTSCARPDTQPTQISLTYKNIDKYFLKQLRNQKHFFSSYLTLCAPDFQTQSQIPSLPEKTKNYELAKYLICYKHLKTHLKILNSVITEQNENGTKTRNEDKKQ